MLGHGMIAVHYAATSMKPTKLLSGGSPANNRPPEIDENIGAAQVSLSDADAAQIEDLMSDVAGHVDVFRPFRWAMEVWS
jgi:hypothetical protein